MLSNLEKSILPESLHSIYNYDDFEEGGKLFITNLQILDFVNINLEVVIDLGNDEDAVTYSFEFKNVANYSVNPDTNSYLEILDNDPRLFPFKSQGQQLYIKQPSKNPDQLAKSILTLLSKKFGNKVTIEDIFDSYQNFLFRCQLSFGLFAKVSDKIAPDFLAFLNEHKMEPNLHTHSVQRTNSDYKIAYLGKSWFVFTELAIKQLN